MSMSDDEGELASPEALEAQERLRNEQVVRCGYLLKKGEQRRTWKKRWFVLRSNRLAYYENDKEYQLLRSIDLRTLSTIAEVRVKRPNVIGLVTSERTFYLQAASKKEMDDWLTALKVVKRELKRAASGNAGAAGAGGPRLPVHRSVSASSMTHGPATAVPESAVLPSFHSTGQLTESVVGSATDIAPEQAQESHSPGRRKVSFGEQPLQKALGALQSWGNAVGSSLSLSSYSQQSAASKASASLSAQPSGNLVAPNSPLSSPSSPDLGYRSYGPSSDEEAIGSDGEELRLSPTSAPLPSPVVVPEEDDSEQEIIVGPPLPGEDDADAVRYEGWLWKLGKSGNGWKKRWFVVRGSKIVAYNDNKEYQPLRVIALSSVISILPAPDTPALQLSKSHPHALKIISPKRTWTLAAETPEEFDRVVKSLHATHKMVMERRRAADRAAGGQASSSNNIEVQVKTIEGGAKLVEVSVGAQPPAK